MKPGDRVHYIPPEGGQPLNGIVKSIHPKRKYLVWVVYNCAGEWKDYWKYTGELTEAQYLKPGWVSPIEPETKFSYN
jgi:hypothetical protein